MSALPIPLTPQERGADALAGKFRMNHNGEPENVRDRFKRHRIQQSMTGDSAIFLCELCSGLVEQARQFFAQKLAKSIRARGRRAGLEFARFLSPPQAEQARRPAVPLGSTD